MDLLVEKLIDSLPKERKSYLVWHEIRGSHTYITQSVTHYTTLEGAISVIVDIYSNKPIMIRRRNLPVSVMYEGTLPEQSLGDLLYTLYKKDIKFEIWQPPRTNPNTQHYYWLDESTTKIQSKKSDKPYKISSEYDDICDKANTHKI
jgi:hypothetical protein